MVYTTQLARRRLESGKWNSGEFRGRHTYFDRFMEAGRLQRRRKGVDGVPGTPHLPEARNR